MNGHLHLTCAHDPAAGRSFLRRQSFRAPMHLGKGYWHEDALLVHAVNSTAGLFAGDVVDWRVEVEPRARLRLVSPSAARVHRAAREGSAPRFAEPAHSEQTFRVGADGWLEVWPELFIPHAGCRYRQSTRVEVAPGGELLFCESLAPGRVASGEAFAWESLHWATDIFHGADHIARERWRLDQGRATGWKDALDLDAPYYATIFFVCEQIDDGNPCWQQIHDLQTDVLRVGVSRLHPAGWMIKILAGDGAVLRRALARTRALLLAARDGCTHGPRAASERF